MRFVIIIIFLLSSTLIFAGNGLARDATLSIDPSIFDSTTATAEAPQSIVIGAIQTNNADQLNVEGLMLLPESNPQTKPLVDLLAWFAPTFGSLTSPFPFGNAELFTNFPLVEAGELYTAYGAVQVRINGVNGPAGNIPNPLDILRSPVITFESESIAETLSLFSKE